jgi:uncharacterized protein YihD (DUF1040 family)
MSTVTSKKAASKPFAPMQMVADSTDSGYTTAVKRFNEFAALHQYPRLEDLTKEQMLGNVANIPGLQRMLSEFCSFILKYKKDEAGTEHIMPGTQKQYLSGTMNAIKRKHPDLDILKPWNVQWYTDLYGALKVRGIVAAIKRGESIGEKTEGIHRELLMDLTKCLLKNNTCDAIEARAVLVMLYHAVGRGGEVSTSNWDTAIWEKREGGRFYLDWGEVKVAKHSVLDFFPDADNNHLICMIHSLAAYLVTSPGKVKSSTVTDAPAWIFPSFVDMADGGATSKASRILKNMVDDVDGLHEGHTVHGLRAGAADDMLLNKDCNIIGAIFRGNWDFTGDCVLFRYLYGKLFTSQAGKVLAGYKNPDQAVAYPDLSVIINEDNADLINNFAISLFSVDLLHKGPLKPFRNAMLAALLMHHHDITAEYGRDHVIVQALNSSATHLLIRTADLYQWGRKIKNDVERKNNLNYNETGSAAERTEADIRQVREQNAQLHKKLDSTHDLVKKLVSVVEDLGKQIDTLRGSKRRHDDIDTADRDCADDVAARKPAAATGITGKVGKVVDAMTRMMQAQKQQHQFSFTSLTLLGLKVADLIVIVAKHRLNLADKEPFGDLTGKQSKNKAKTVFDHALKEAASGSPDLQQAALTIKQKCRHEPTSKEYGVWLESLRQAATTIAENQLRVIAEAYKNSNAWKVNCQKKGGALEANAMDPIGEIKLAIGSIYAKIDLLKLYKTQN